MFSTRRIEPEVLDHVSPELARPNLADLVRINERFGGHSVLRRACARAIKRNEPFSLLDIGAASGDSARLIAREFPSAGIVSLDQNATNIEKAPQPKLLADAFALPFPDASFDYVLCSLFLHHFSDSETIRLLASFYALARRTLIVCDLERHWLAYAFLPSTRALFGWNDITVSDGKKSVRAAFRFSELASLARQAGLRNVEIQRYRPAFRLSLLAAK